MLLFLDIHLKAAEIFRNYASALVSVFWQIFKIGVVYFIIRIVGQRIIDRAADSIASREPENKISRIRTLQALLRSILNYLLWFVTGVMLLSAFNIDPKPVLASAGVLGLAVGFGAQRLVRDVIAGFFILLEDQYSVGDYVTIGNVCGQVVEVGMRMTKVRSDDGRLYLLSNGDVTLVCNHSRNAVEIFLDVSVAADQDINAIFAVLNKIGEDFKVQNSAMSEPFNVTGLSSISASSVTIRMTGKAFPPGLEGLLMRFREELHKRLTEACIRTA